MPNKIIIVRHGETDFNKQRRIQGWLDIPLNELGLSQASLASTKLAEIQIDAIYSSDLLRAYQTAQIIATKINQAIITRVELRERDMGIFAGWQFESEPDPVKESLWAEFEASRDAEDLSWNKHGGESLAQMSTRIKQFMDHVDRAHHNQTIVIVTHGGTVNRILEHFGIKPASEGFRPIKNAVPLVLSKKLAKYTLEEL